MQRRFTLIQGGLIKHWRGPSTAEPLRHRGWRIDLRRPSAVDRTTFAAWRELAEEQEFLDPFSHPDYLLTAARHGGRGLDLAFAFAFEAASDGGDALGGVLPLLMPHPVWGRAARLWHPTLAQAPVEPLFREGAASRATEAVLRHLWTMNPRADLRLDRVRTTGRFVQELQASERLRLDARIDRASIPADQIVRLTESETADWIESVTEPHDIRDAVERYLLADAEISPRPLLADPATSAIARVVPRLFAHRGWACVELRWRGKTVVGAAIRLGRQESRVLWCSVSHETAGPIHRTVDIDLHLVEGADAPAPPLRLVGS